MSARCKDIIEIIEKMAPPCLSMERDNVGLLIGDENSMIDTALIALDINDGVIDEAINNRCSLIITHHPVIFSLIKSINTGDFKGRQLHKLISNNINVYAAHTNLDAADGGINDYLAELFGLTGISVIGSVYTKRSYKFAVYVPVGYEDKVRDAMCAVGAGTIGRYYGCTFNTQGQGTFMPLEGSSPFIGELGVMTKVSEVKIETIVDEDKLETVMENMLKAHPYEEPAYDIYPLFNMDKVYGFGRVGYLTNPKTLKELSIEIKSILGIGKVNVVGDLDRIIRKVGLCSGDGSDFIKEAKECGCDVYITGDVRYHDACDARDMGIALIDAGHFATENIYMPQLMNIMEAAAVKNSIDVEFIMSSVNKSPFIQV